MANFNFVLSFRSLIFIAAVVLHVDAARILSVAFISNRSHKITYEPLLYELAARGHQVTIVAPFVSGKTRPNVREIQTIDWNSKMDQATAGNNIFEKKAKGERLFDPFHFLRFAYETCGETYDLPEVKSLLREPHFDLIFVSALVNECASGFVYALNTSVIQISPISAPSQIATVFGNPSPTSFVPHLFTPFEDRMTFWQRVVNFFADLIFSAIMVYYAQPMMAELYRQKLNDPTIPLHDEIMRNASLILSNSHLSLSKPRPFLPDIVEVGGMHCHPAKPLPKELDEFVNESEDQGFILFSMGSILKASTMPEEYRQTFLRAFARLQPLGVRVIWKWETETMADLPTNVKLSKWLPQQDVLGHPKCRAFITHGGLGGTTEAAYHGVPLIGIPMAGDQATNLRKSEAAGWAITLEFATLTEDAVFDAISRVVNDKSYHQNAQRLSKIFRDQPDKPLDRAVFWTEYVLRHGGATHLRSAARDLGFFAYHSIDVIAALIGVLLVLLYAIGFTLRLLIRKICVRSSVSKDSSKSKKRN